MSLTTPVLCTACTGAGWFYSTGWPEYRRQTCPVCRGSGHLDSSAALVASPAAERPAASTASPAAGQNAPGVGWGNTTPGANLERDAG